MQEITVTSFALRAPQLLTLAVSLALAGSAAAQVASPKVVISNTSPIAEIGLESGSNVEFAANGDLQIRCRKVGANCDTANIGGGGGTGTNPPTNVVLTPSSTAITANAPFNLQWGSTNAEACFGVGPSGVSGWTSQVLTSSRGAPGLSLSLAQGSYAFQMRCFNAGGSTTVSASTVTVSPGGNPVGGDYCSEFYAGGLPTGSAFNGHGFTRVDVPFGTVFGTTPGSTAGITSGVPGNYLNPSQGRYMAIPFTFTSDTGPSTNMQLSWVEAQGSLGISTGAVTVTISPCPGDFRPAVTGSPDPYLSFVCRAAASIGAALTASSSPGTSQCRAPKDKQMYINIATYEMFVPTPPATTTCSGNSTCGVAMRLI